MQLLLPFESAKDTRKLFALSASAPYLLNIDFLLPVDLSNHQRLTHFHYFGWCHLHSLAKPLYAAPSWDAAMLAYYYTMPLVVSTPDCVYWLCLLWFSAESGLLPPVSLTSQYRQRVAIVTKRDFARLTFFPVHALCPALASREAACILMHPLIYYEESAVRYPPITVTSWRLWALLLGLWRCSHRMPSIQSDAAQSTVCNEVTRPSSILSLSLNTRTILLYFIS